MSLNCPPKLPTGVRSALTITASSIVASSDEGHLIRARGPADPPPSPYTSQRSGEGRQARPHAVVSRPAAHGGGCFWQQSVAVDDGGGQVDQLAVGRPGLLAQHLEGGVRH